MKTKAILGCTMAAIVILTNNLTVDALNKENIILDNHTTGWVSSNQKWYYYDNGVMLKNTNIAGYHLGADGAMVANRTLKIDGKEYIFTSSGFCANK